MIVDLRRIDSKGRFEVLYIFAGAGVLEETNKFLMVGYMWRGCHQGIFGKVICKGAGSCRGGISTHPESALVFDRFNIPEYNEAEREERINQATGEAAALMTVAEARAKSLAVVAQSLSKKDGKHAASLTIAEKYVEAFQNLAKTSNTLILPNNTADVSSVVSQAFAIYRTLVNRQEQENQASMMEDNSSEPTQLRIADICTEKPEAKEESAKSSPPPVL
ncbi:hypothetical protein LSTR_LSTR011386 [Laodelphax striatellus]|uniref:STML2-like C-terminal extension domain-containing protein n=1 Tax=Laodelphax striatellus TaxID=195883 RepID=A0A482X8A8_LAOST|nr:hypothetical protein LSTR_LSTR011386 [Laodelphax striatellus]